jgi:hypothetical protein
MSHNRLLEPPLVPSEGNSSKGSMAGAAFLAADVETANHGCRCSRGHCAIPPSKLAAGCSDGQAPW